MAPAGHTDESGEVGRARPLGKKIRAGWKIVRELARRVLAAATEDDDDAGWRYFCVPRDPRLYPAEISRGFRRERDFKERRTRQSRAETGRKPGEREFNLGGTDIPVPRAEFKSFELGGTGADGDGGAKKRTGPKEKPKRRACTPARRPRNFRGGISARGELNFRGYSHSVRGISKIPLLRGNGLAGLAEEESARLLPVRF